MVEFGWSGRPSQDAACLYRSLRLAVAEFQELVGSYNVRATERANADARERAQLVTYIGVIVSAAWEAAHDTDE
jgi:hypothetical protein